MVQAFDPQTTPILDQDTLQQLLDLDDGQLGLIQEMFQLYCEDTPGRIDAIRVTIQEGNLHDMSEVAHAVKGASSTMGASRPRAVAAMLEAAGRKGDLETPELLDLSEQLATTFTESTQALEAFLAERS